MSHNNVAGQFGDTTLTKVFVGGLAWETPKEALKDHFDHYGHILEAVIITDKITGRSKGYGFVTFKDPESAKKACEDASPIINGRRANCNLASLGARRPRSSTGTTTPPPQPQLDGGQRSPAAAPAGNQVQWYYPATQFAHQHHQAVPFYGYSPTYIATHHDYNGYNQKVRYGSGGSYMYPGQAMVGATNTMVPIYPVYHHGGFNHHHHHHHQSQTMGIPMPAHHFFPTTGAAAHIPTIPTTAMIAKPQSMAPPNTTGEVID
ncbi:hypothetical protein ACFE04_016540 [Oxalis oulophora]